MSRAEWEEFWGDLHAELGAEAYASAVTNLAWQGGLEVATLERLELQAHAVSGRGKRATCGK